MPKDKTYYTGVVIIVWVALLTSYPYIFSLILPVPSLAAMQVLVVVSLLSWAMFMKPKLHNLPKNITNIFIIQTIVWILYIYIHRDTSYFTRLIYILSSYLALLSLYNYQNGIRLFFEKYNKWIAFMALGGAAMFFVILLTGMQPLFEFVEQDNRPGYFFGLTATNTWSLNVIRFAGFFDEPGQMAFWGVWALLFNHLFFHNKRGETILIYCLVLTFSLAYYIQLFLYLLFFKIKSAKTGLLIISMGFIIGFGIYSMKESYPIVYKFTFERLETSNSGGIKGDNRSNLADLAKKTFIQHPIVGVGARKAVEKMEYMGDNPYTLLAYDGIIGALNTYLPLIIIIVLNYKKINFLKAVFIIVVGYLQRPYNVYFISPFMLYCFVTLSYLKYNVKSYCNYRML